MKELVILDTNIVSYLFKKHPNLLDYWEYLLEKRLAISFMTEEEILYGAFKDSWGEKSLRSVRSLIDRFEIFHSTEETIEHCARVRANRKHQPISVRDAWIAATALALNCPLVTHNPKDFVDIPNLEIVTFHSTKPR